MRILVPTTELWGLPIKMSTGFEGTLVGKEFDCNSCARDKGVGGDLFAANVSRLDWCGSIGLEEEQGEQECFDGGLSLTILSDTEETLVEIKANNALQSVPLAMA